MGGWQMKWPKCSHEVDHGGWTDDRYTIRGSYSTPTIVIDHSTARCRLCDRPLLFVIGPVSAVHLRDLRRIVAEWMLGKEGEHASNTVVVKSAWTITRGALEC